MKYFLILLCCIALLLLTATTEPADVNLPSEQPLLVLTNQERARYGLAPLRASPILNNAASWHAQDMAVFGYFDHTDSLGRSFDQRLRDFGYDRYTRVGENIYRGSTSPVDALEAWMNSPGHRTNILNPDFTEMGVGVYGVYWVQDFGNRPDVTFLPLISQPPSP